MSSENEKEDAEALANKKFLEDIAAIEQAMQSVTPYRQLLKGKPFSKSERAKRCWYQGKLILQSEFDKLTWEEQHASQNVIRNGKN